ncbi:MAG: DNA/RNA non-specific endonuclease [Solobacterium sp.]|nr:DNA/RNA non-specific endonuclease [Solobacterium sp.]
MKKAYRILLRLTALCLIIVLGLYLARKLDLYHPDYPGSFSYEEIPDYTNDPYTVVNDGIPFFTDEELNSEPFEFYSELDSLNRCGYAFALVSRDTMPVEERGEIRDVIPSGWHWDKYDFIQYEYLYNRCHLIAYALTGENANPKNLITGTRYLNYSGMRNFEGMIASYIYRTGNPVLYRVTPVFIGSELVARGVLLEAQSTEDEGLRFCVFCYNVQPGVIINYQTGESYADLSQVH